MGTSFNTKGEENKINEIQENLKSDKLLYSHDKWKRRGNVMQTNNDP